MNFSDEDLHDAMKLALEALVSIINNATDLNQKGNAAINLANLILEIHARQNPEFMVEDEFSDFEDDDEFD